MLSLSSHGLYNLPSGKYIQTYPGALCKVYIFPGIPTHLRHLSTVLPQSAPARKLLDSRIFCRLCGTGYSDLPNPQTSQKNTEIKHFQVATIVDKHSYLSVFSTIQKYTYFHEIKLKLRVNFK